MMDDLTSEVAKLKHLNTRHEKVMEDHKRRMELCMDQLNRAEKHKKELLQEQHAKWVAKF